MASIVLGEKYVVVSSAAIIVVYSQDTKFELTIPQSVAVDEKLDSKEKTVSSSTEANITCLRFSHDGEYFAAADDDKNLAVWKTTTERWSVLGFRKVFRKAVALGFTKNGCLLLADKAGDVYEIDMSQDGSMPKLLMGHVSMLLDLIITPDDKLIITSDRDEKIRISHYPNAYNIQCYCMGHTEYVNSLLLLPSNPEILVSGSGDGSIRFWLYRSGKEIATIPFSAFYSKQVNRQETELESENGSETSKKLKLESSRMPMKAIRFSGENNILALLLADFKELLLFQLTVSGDCVKWQHLQTLDFLESIWDVQFCSDGLLWVLLPDKNQPLQLFKLTQSKFVKLDDLSPRLGSISQFVAKDWEILKKSLNVKNEHHSLFKQTFDNVEHYYSRKTERIAAKIQKT